MGSGTNGVACINTGRNFIGIEKNSEYFEIATDRIDKVRNSSDLMEILSLEKLTRLKVNAPKGCCQEEIDTFLAALKKHLPKNNWIELGLRGYEFHPDLLKGMSLKHFSVTCNEFEIN